MDDDIGLTVISFCGISLNTALITTMLRFLFLTLLIGPALFAFAHQMSPVAQAMTSDSSKNELAAVLLLLSRGSEASVEVTTRSSNAFGRVSGSLSERDRDADYFVTMNIGSGQTLNVPLEFSNELNFTFPLPAGLVSAAGLSTSGTVRYEVVVSKDQRSETLYSGSVGITVSDYTGQPGIPSLAWARLSEVLAFDAKARSEALAQQLSAPEYDEFRDLAATSQDLGGALLRDVVVQLLFPQSIESERALAELDRFYYQLLLAIAPETTSRINFDIPLTGGSGVFAADSSDDESAAPAKPIAIGQRVTISSKSATLGAQFISLRDIDEYFSPTEMAAEASGGGLEIARTLRSNAGLIAVGVAGAALFGVVAVGTATTVGIAAAGVVAVATLAASGTALVQQGGTAAVSNGDIAWSDVREPISDWAGATKDYLLGVFSPGFENLPVRSAASSVISELTATVEDVVTEVDWSVFSEESQEIGELLGDGPDLVAEFADVVTSDFLSSEIPSQGPGIPTPVAIAIEADDVSASAAPPLSSVDLKVTTASVSPIQNPAYMLEVFADGIELGSFEVNITELWEVLLTIADPGCPRFMDVTITHIDSGSSESVRISNERYAMCSAQCTISRVDYFDGPDFDYSIVEENCFVPSVSDPQGLGCKVSRTIWEEFDFTHRVWETGESSPRCPESDGARREGTLFTEFGTVRPVERFPFFYRGLSGSPSGSTSTEISDDFDGPAGLRRFEQVRAENGNRISSEEVHCLFVRSSSGGETRILHDIDTTTFNPETDEFVSSSRQSTLDGCPLERSSLLVLDPRSSHLWQCLQQDSCQIDQQNIVQF